MNEAANSPEDLAHAHIGMVCALPIELDPFLAQCSRLKKYSGDRFVFRGGYYGSVRVAVVESGMGFAKARDATHALIDAHTPRWVLSCGFSGALVPEMKIGDIVIANDVVDEHGQELTVSLKMAEDRENGLYVGRILTADHLVRTIAEKRQLADKRDALAVDMESLAVAQVCHERKTRFMAVRSISDDLASDLPPEVLTLVGETGAVRIGAALGALWKRPGSMKEMWKLREGAYRAADRLATFLDGIVTQLSESTPPGT